MKALSKFFLPLIMLLGLAACGGGGGNSNGNTGGAFTGGTYTLTITAGATTIAQSSSTPITVTVKNPDGTTASNGTSVTLSVTPAGVGTVSAGTGTGGVTATGTTAGGSVAFLFNSAAQVGTAHVMASVQNTNGTSSTSTVDIAVSSASSALIKLTASTTTLPLNPYGPAATTYPFPSNYIGSPYIAEVTIEWRRANGQLVNGTLKVNAAISPVTVAGFSTLDDPTTKWDGQTANPPTVSGNEFLTILGSGPVNVTAGIGTIFVHADNVPGTAVLSVTGIDPDTQQSITNQIAITVAGAASTKLPGAVTISQASGGVYVSGSNGPQSKVVSAQVLDGNGAFVADPTDGKGNSWNNVQFQIIGPAGTDATLSAIGASGATQSGASVATVTHSGIASVTFRAGAQQGPVQVKATVDRGDNNVDNQIQDPVSATATVVVSDGKLFNLTLTQPGSNANSILVNGVSTGATAPGGGLPTNPDGTYSLTLSVQGQDRQGNPVIPGTQIKFGEIDAPLNGRTGPGRGQFAISGNDGNPQEGGTLFTAPSGAFTTAGGGAGPGDTLLVFGKQVDGNRDLENSRTVQTINGASSLYVGTSFNTNDDTGVSVDYGAVLPYIVGRAVDGNITKSASTNTVGVATVALTYPVSKLGKLAAVWAQGSGGTSAKTVDDILLVRFAGVAAISGNVASVSASPNPIYGNTAQAVNVCIVDALGSPIQGIQFGFQYTGTGTGSVDGSTGSGLLANLTDNSGCAAAAVTTTGVPPTVSPATGSGQFKFCSGSLCGTVNVVVNLAALQVSPASVTVPSSGSTSAITVTAADTLGHPTPGAVITMTCTASGGNGATLTPSTATLTTGADGTASVSVVAANFVKVGTATTAPQSGAGTCTFTAAGSASATVTFSGSATSCDFSPKPSGC